MTGWGWGWDVLITIAGGGMLTGLLLWAEHVQILSTRMRKLGPSRPEPEHVCPLPWWRPFRKLGERIQCTQCGDTWRWDYPTAYTRDGGGREWVSERGEAYLAALEDEANRNAH
jgi:hypothetical protein